MDGAAWLRALNTKLPRTVRVMDCEPADASFHAQFDACGKTYRYDLFTGPVLPPLLAGLSWHVPKKPDLSKLTELAALFEGEHDFAAFAANRGDAESNPDNTRRRIFRANLQTQPNRIRLSFHGSGFLYKMVRLIVGAAIRCAQGGVSIPEIQDLLENPATGKKSPLAAPPDGLCLVSVDYSAGSGSGSLDSLAADAS